MTIEIGKNDGANDDDLDDMLSTTSRLSESSNVRDSGALYQKNDDLVEEIQKQITEMESNHERE